MILGDDNYFSQQLSLYWEGVFFVNFLKIRLKADLELKPESKAIASSEKFSNFESLILAFTSSTLNWLMYSKKFSSNFSFIIWDR